jgi:hypothetical protein
MTRSNWEVYAILRSVDGKAAAERYRHKVNARNAPLMGEPIEDPVWTIVKDYGIDGYITKCFIPGDWSMDDRNDFADSIWIESYPSAYDCTGRAFTRYVDMFDVPGGIWVYHHIGFDV